MNATNGMDRLCVACMGSGGGRVQKERQQIRQGPENRAADRGREIDWSGTKSRYGA